MPKPTVNMTPDQRRAFNEAFEETRRRVLAIAQLPGVTLGQAIGFTAQGLDAKDVERLSPANVMKRAEWLQ